MTTLQELSPSAERIADAAQVLVQQVGYNGFSFEHISQLVGMRKASIHHHFASKVDLGVTVAQRYTHQFDGALRQILTAVKPAPQRLQAYADLFETTFMNDHHLCVCGMLGAESNSLDAAVNLEVRHFFQLNVAWLTDVIQDGLASGSLKSAQGAPVLAETLLSLLEGAMLVGRSLKSPLGPRRISDVFLSSLIV
ncbi:TetR/AcrR family transcriptional regulator [Janthinobacterium lividum]|jgi:TetR/AcrR family transcriptional repressor of nem operon|uniref:TetR family transcriptional regulator n=1 Tax=Janthinobacterium lividum TaxID=29581 RepID=A0A1E8PLW4_9BURK|nr:TetR/AcrR family transcriptional regulator [Janthinobacterium lividum]OFJ47155.1 TetR family transcriptional regulator [Janthinobacterium lividum]